MGMQWAETGRCVGVLYPVTEKELYNFDEREMGYGRKTIDIENVELVEYLEDEHYDSPDHAFFLKAVAERRSDFQIWVYVPLKPLPPDEDHPIAQTYLDVILHGCLDIHKDFAREFIADTKGWNPQELLTDNEHDSDDKSSRSLDEDSNDVISWVNDRDRPIYKGADTEYSDREGPRLDILLREHRPDEFHRRKRHHKNPQIKCKKNAQVQDPSDNY
jgi:hypothetical protein